MYSLSKFPIQIPKSKTRFVLLFLASIILILSGIWLLINPGGEVPYFFGSKISLRITAILSILFFGVKAVYLFVKLVDKTPGLEISEYGITDHSGKADAGLIKWDDINDIHVISIFHDRILMIILNNPEAYITRQTNQFAKKAMEMNYRLYGSPVGLSSIGLKINFTSLKILIEQSFRRYKLADI